MRHHVLAQVLLEAFAAGLLAGILLGYAPRQPVAILHFKVCTLDSGYLIVMSDGKLTRLTTQKLYYDEDAADALNQLLDTYPPQTVTLGGCT